MQDSRQIMLIHWLQNHMNVVGHDAPREQAVPASIKECEGIGNDFGDAILAQAAFSRTLV
jgi:ribosomal protein S13